MYAIIKNAALPLGIQSSTNNYPFMQMNVGDGFDAPDDLGKSPKGFSRRLTSIKNGIAKVRHTYGTNLRFVVGRHPEHEDILRCVRTR
jgi:hypothetical protein